MGAILSLKVLGGGGGGRGLKRDSYLLCGTMAPVQFHTSPSIYRATVLNRIL